MTKKRAAQESTAARVGILDERRGDQNIVGVQNLATGQRWEWREEDFPGLADFLTDWLFTWHRRAHRDYRRSAGISTANADRAGAMRPVLDARNAEIRAHAATERAQKKHGYIKRTAARFGISAERVKEIISA